MGIPAFHGRVNAHGTLRLDHPKAFVVHLQSLNDQRVTVAVRPYADARTVQQNRYYWSVVVGMIAEAAGYTPDEAHDALRGEFLKEPGDGPLRKIRSTAQLSISEFHEYVERCRQLAAEQFGLNIPDPNEVDAA